MREPAPQLKLRRLFNICPAPKGLQVEKCLGSKLWVGACQLPPENFCPSSLLRPMHFYFGVPDSQQLEDMVKTGCWRKLLWFLRKQYFRQKQRFIQHKSISPSRKCQGSTLQVGSNLVSANPRDFPLRMCCFGGEKCVGLTFILLNSADVIYQ